MFTFTKGKECKDAPKYLEEKGLKFEVINSELFVGNLYLLFNVNICELSVPETLCVSLFKSTFLSELLFHLGSSLKGKGLSSETLNEMGFKLFIYIPVTSNVSRWEWWEGSPICKYSWSRSKKSVKTTLNSVPLASTCYRFCFKFRFNSSYEIVKKPNITFE